MTAEDGDRNVIASCSAARVRSDKYNLANVVLTAKHCGYLFELGVLSGISGPTTNFYVGNGIPVDPTAEPTAEALMCHAGMVRYQVLDRTDIGRGSYKKYKSMYAQSADAAGQYAISDNFNDLTIAWLNSNVEGATPIMLAPPLAASAVGGLTSSAQIIGFGRQTLNGKTTVLQKHLVPMKLGAARETVIESSWLEAAPGLGDSGGPMVAEFPNNVGVRLLGVHSTAGIDTNVSYEALVTNSFVAGDIDRVLAAIDRAPPFESGGETCPPCPTSTDGGTSPADPGALGVR